MDPDELSRAAAVVAIMGGAAIGARLARRDAQRRARRDAGMVDPPPARPGDDGSPEQAAAWARRYPPAGPGLVDRVAAAAGRLGAWVGRRT